MAAAKSPAKILRPRIRNPVARQRLFDQIDRCRDYPVIWISAPAGSGKTTLAASYLDQKKCRALWYQMDEGDSDPATFFYYMGLAARRAAPRRKTPLPLFTPEYRLGIPTFTRRYFEQLYDRLKPPYVIVLDNYQLVDEASCLHESLGQGLAMVPEGVTVLVLSRQAPPAAFTRLRANRHIHVFASDSINFTLEESKTFFYKGKGVVLTDTAIARFHDLTRGWAAGLALFMESLRIKNMDLQSPIPFSREEIFNYFAREIFDNLDAETRQILLKTAFLPKMTASMAQRITGSDRAEEIFAGLCRRHLFTQRDNQADPNYQYHPLFREFLISLGQQTMSEEQQRLHANAAAILEEAGQIDDAADSLLRAKDYDRLARFLLVHATPLIDQGRYRMVQRWLEKIPPEILDTSPGLIIWHGRSRQFFDPLNVLHLAERAYNQFTIRKDHLGQVVACSTVLSCIGLIITMRGEFPDIDIWLQRLESHLEEGLTFLRQIWN